MAVVWTISQLERQTSDDGVTVAHWTASDSEVIGEVTHTGNSYGSSSFTPDSSAGDFVAYADLTEAAVVVWVKANIGDSMVSDTETSIANQITISKVPVSAAGVPW